MSVHAQTWDNLDLATRRDLVAFVALRCQNTAKILSNMRKMVEQDRRKLNAAEIEVDSAKTGLHDAVDALLEDWSGSPHPS